MKTVKLILLSSFLFFISNAANAGLIYVVDETIDVGTISGTITVDSLGLIDESNISDWSLTINNGNGDIVIWTPSNSIANSFGNNLSATSTQLLFDYDSEAWINQQYFGFADINYNGDALCWGNPGACDVGAARSRISLNGIFLSSEQSGIKAIGAIASVPEPSTLAIFALGMIGLVSRKFKK